MVGHFIFYPKKLGGPGIIMVLWKGIRITQGDPQHWSSHEGGLVNWQFHSQKKIKGISVETYPQLWGSHLKVLGLTKRNCFFSGSSTSNFLTKHRCRKKDMKIDPRTNRFVCLIYRNGPLDRTDGSRMHIRDGKPKNESRLFALKWCLWSKSLARSAQDIARSRFQSTFESCLTFFRYHNAIALITFIS